jgi:prepilin-type N-terminal cleavage/methylation domain-containing protein
MTHNPPTPRTGAAQDAAAWERRRLAGEFLDRNAALTRRQPASQLPLPPEGGVPFAGSWRAPAAPRPDRTAFTLIEMIGALAVVAILASLAVPVVVRQIDRATWNQEVTNLGAISNAIVTQVLRSKTISNPTSWATDAAPWLNLPASRVATNSRSYARAFVIDPAGWFGSVSLPFVQSTNGTLITTNARALIVSSIGATLPIASGIISAAQFNDIWTTQEGFAPPGWTGRGDDLVIQRINLQPLFHRVSLFNRDLGVRPAYSVDAANPTIVTNAIDSYYFDGSVLSLSDTNLAVMQSQIINSDLSRVFESGAWDNSIGPGHPSASAMDMESLAYTFLSLTNGPTTIPVAAALLQYMNAYSSWANMCFDFQGKLTNRLSRVPDYLVIQEAIGCFSTNCAIVP